MQTVSNTGDGQDMAQKSLPVELLVQYDAAQNPMDVCDAYEK